MFILKERTDSENRDNVVLSQLFLSFVENIELASDLRLDLVEEELAADLKCLEVEVDFNEISVSHVVNVRLDHLGKLLLDVSVL